MVKATGRKTFEQDIIDAKFAGLATGKGWDTVKFLNL